MIGIIILIGVIIIELSKHFFTRTALKFIIMIIVGIILFFAVVSSLDSNVVSSTDNEYVQTGAAIMDNVNDQPLIIKIKETIKTTLIELKEKIINRDN